MGLLSDIQQDIQDITSNADEFGVEMTISNGTDSITVVGLHAKRHLMDDTDGNNISTRKSYVSFSESLMTGYPVRINNVVSMIGHTVTVPDSTGTRYTYVINQSYPDETVGLIVCILGNMA